MRYIISLSIFLWLPQWLIAQTLPVLPQKKPETVTNSKPKTAKRAPVKTKETKVFDFSDDFSDNENSWAFVSDADNEINIRNGKLIIKGITDKTFSTRMDFDLDVSKDFSCSVMVKWIEGVQNSSLGIIYCSDFSSESLNRFGISGDGSYKMSYYENDGNWRELKGWTANSFINKGAIPNIIMIKKEGSYLSFYINDHLIETFPFDGGFGNGFGFIVAGIQTVEFDNFELKGIMKK